MRDTRDALRIVSIRISEMRDSFLALVFMASILRLNQSSLSGG